MTMTLSGDGTITGLVAGGLPDATITSDDLAAGAALNSVSDGVFFRNRIINGDMRIDQRNAGAAVTVSTDVDTYCMDRFLAAAVTSNGAFTVQQVTEAPVGFSNSAKITVTTEDTGLTGSQSYQFQQKIEGFNTSDLSFGTANAKTVTLSFWVRSSLTGTFGGALSNSAFNRSYPFTYSISVADTWEYKTVTIAGDTSGTWIGSTNGIGLRIYFGLGAADRAGTAGAWAGAGYVTATGAVSVIGTLNATWYVTGIQLEVGSVATPFERRPYGTELSLCQRYYYHWGWSGQNTYCITAHNILTTASYGSFWLPTVMRANPTLTTNGTAAHYGAWQGTTQLTCSAVPLIDASHPQTPFVVWQYASGLTSPGSTMCRITNSSAFLGFSAEL